MSNPATEKSKPKAISTDTSLPGAVAPSERTKVRRIAERGIYDRAAIAAILDEAFVCHVGFVHEGAPRVIPCVYARSGNSIYLHGSTANRMLRNLCRAEACISVTLIDGLVLARSAFHHSVNFRSVVIFAQGEEVKNAEEKMEALHLTVEHSIPGRWKDVRPPNDEELLLTRVVRIPIDEASAKVRRGDPIDAEFDHALDCWAGQIPLRLTPSAPIDDAILRSGIEAPAYAREYLRPLRIVP